MDRFDPFVKYADVYGDIINWEKDPMNKPQNQNKYFFSDGKTYYEQICKMLRLMSVFKEAFNQIYSNEDEISEAWENFVNNLSASVVEGSEPDVTLTWTDDSVNFEFTMVPGVPGEQGVGITSISFNSDYTMTITLSDGNTYTSMSLKGETGPQGPQGETGSGLQILDVYATLADLQSAHPTGQPGDAYQVGSGGNYTLYIWSSSQSAWVQAGTLGTVSPSVSNPLMDGTASAGSLNQYSRGDHVHPTDTSRASKEELDALIKTSQALIDQSFTYRESPAIQDGLARIDKIKGNTLIWNQLIGRTDSYTTTKNGITITITGASDNSISLTAQGTVNLTAEDQNYYSLIPTMNIKNGHKYLLSSTSSTFYLYGYDAGTTAIDQQKSIFTSTRDALMGFTIRPITSAFTEGKVINETFYVMFIDLTQMFGAGNEPTTVEEFTSLFPLPYYAYNAGTLISFNGTGLKATGKNEADIPFEQGAVSQSSGFTYQASKVSSATRIRCVSLAVAEKNKIYKCDWNTSIYDCVLQAYNENRLSTGASGNPFNTWHTASFTFTGTGYVAVAFKRKDGANITPSEIDAIRPNLYLADTESITNLPTLTYFPTGMKSAGTVYDELTPIKATTRIGVKTFNGSENWNYDSNNALFQCAVANAVITNATTQYNVYTKNNRFDDKSWATRSDGSLGMYFGVSVIFLKSTQFADVNALKTWLQSNPLTVYYELATPTETAVDIDLSFNAYENGTEQLLPVNGSVPSTSPIIADMTYMSIDDAMEYIIDKLANVPENTQQILDSLEDDVADLQTDVGALQPAVSALQTSVRNINTNIGQISSTVASHTASISDMQSGITDLNTGLNDLEDTVTDNTSRIGTLETGLSTTNGNVQNLETSVSDLNDTVTAQGTTVTALDSIIQDISNNPVISSLGSHELGFVAAYVSATLPANTGTRVTIPKPTIFPNNYTPLFIVGMSTGSYNVSICEIPSTFGNRDSVNCRVWNHGSEQTTQITVYILCMRQRQSQ